METEFPFRLCFISPFLAPKVVFLMFNKSDVEMEAHTPLVYFGMLSAPTPGGSGGSPQIRQSHSDVTLTEALASPRGIANVVTTFHRCS